MAIVGQERSYHKKYNFAVELDGITVGWFESVSGLEAEAGVVEQHEGGVMITANKSPGKVKFPPITLKAGSTQDDQLYQWWKQVADPEGLGGKGSGQPDGSYERNGAIVQLDRNGAPLVRYEFVRAWPSKFTAGDWDAKSDDNVVSEMVLQVKYWTRKVL